MEAKLWARVKDEILRFGKLLFLLSQSNEIRSEPHKKQVRKDWKLSNKAISSISNKLDYIFKKTRKIWSYRLKAESFKHETY